jgi:hypothetical protein
MSAPTTHDPLVVNTQDGTCWMRRHLTRDGHGLYALAGSVAGAPDSVLTRYVELREMGLASVAYAMPMPVGSEPQPLSVEREREIRSLDLLGLMSDRVAPVISGHLAVLLAEIDRLREERHSTNESVSEAAETLRANRDRIDGLESTNAALRARLAEVEGQRAALAERLRAGQTWRQDRLVSEDSVSQPELRSIFEIPLAAPLDGITRQIAPVQALREEPPLKGRARLDELTVERAEATHWKRLGLEDPHESPLHRTDRIPHDMPPLDGGQ